ncbi:hypothetical protein ASG29_11615 [Sphingomonas sp. Leaf412]|uniref:WYL domain-containing protein n=1 Tax=Sphingomonas sp. Leaf412 TaxID=1736370 RepID=UPI0007016728|nr:WYL domain-containing protein [Sphingomonas sp. Leaf412]KQT32426.1 hypothetical protein ASG29_11615 [Sphingomonas sp. Leaf412]
MNAVTDTPPAAVPDTVPVVFEAVVKKQTIAATYNRGTVTLAPHVVYTKHGEIYLDAVTLERDGKPPKEEKLGAFKLSGLSGLRITPRRFTPSALFDAGDAKYEATLLAVEV